MRSKLWVCRTSWERSTIASFLSHQPPKGRTVASDENCLRLICPFPQPQAVCADQSQLTVYVWGIAGSPTQRPRTHLRNVVEITPQWYIVTLKLFITCVASRLVPVQDSTSGWSEVLGGDSGARATSTLLTYPEQYDGVRFQMLSRLTMIHVGYWMIVRNSMKLVCI